MSDGWLKPQGATMPGDQQSSPRSMMIAFTESSRPDRAKVKRFVRVFTALLTFIFLISIVFSGIQHRCLLAAVLFLLQLNDEGEV